MATCEHEGLHVGRACVHLIAPDHQGYIEAFTGRGVESDLLCEPCASANDRTQVVATCVDCDRLARTYGWIGVTGTPEIVVERSRIAIVHEELELACPDLVDLRPVTGADRNRWLGLTAKAELYAIDLDTGTVKRLLHIDSVDTAAPLELHVSANGRFVAIANRRGARGTVLDLETVRVTVPIVRDNYQAENCDFPIAFLERDGRTLVAYAPGWNRMELADAATGELLTTRDAMTYARGEQRPAHYLDYFHCRLAVSPRGSRIADGGWIWHPVGVVSTWSLDAWVANPFESEDGPSRRQLRQAEYHWDSPMVWLDEHRLAIAGYGGDDSWMVEGVVIYDAFTGQQEAWFATSGGGELVFDRWLYILGDNRLEVWDVERGVRLFETSTPAARYHPTAKLFASLPANGRITIARLQGQLAAATWNHGAVTTLARAGELDGLPILGDALEASGCDDAELLAHCRQPGPHGARCWAFDRLLTGP